MDVDLVSPTLQQAAAPEDIELLLAATEHSSSQSLAIRHRDDMLSVRHWSGRVEPFEHQIQNLISFANRAPALLIADDVGMGKTISSGLILSELIVRNRVKRALVIAPKVLLGQWQAELKEKFGIDGIHASGQQKLREAISSNLPLVVTTYHTARDNMELLEGAGFDMLILDEAHTIRNLYGTDSPPKTATAIRDAIKRSSFQYLLLLTATPIHNRLWDIYSLVDVLSDARNHANPLGTPSAFRQEYIADGATARILRTEKSEQFRRLVRDYLVRTNRFESGLLFPRRQLKMSKSREGATEREMFELAKSSIRRLSRLEKISLAIALTSSPAAFSAQVQNSGEKGKIAPEIVKQIKQLAHAEPLGSKWKPLKNLIQQLRTENPESWRLLVFTHRKATQDSLGVAIEELGIPVGYIGGDHSSSQAADIAKFQTEPPEVNVIVSTDAGSQGINLQASNLVVNYDLPWNPMILEQRIGRVQRLNSKHENVIVTNCVVAGSIEDRIVNRLLQKLMLISTAVGGVEGVLQASDLNDEKFEQQVADIVLLALEEQDHSEQMRRAELSIERARATYEEQSGLVDDTLGTADNAYQVNTDGPELERLVPRLSEKELVRNYFLRDGTFEPVGDGSFLAEKPTVAKHYAVFDSPGGSSSKAFRSPTRYYAKGEVPFDRIVTEVAKQRLYMHSETTMEPASAREIAQEWSRNQNLGPKVTGFRVKSQQSLFTGRLAARVKATVGIDSYERVVEVSSPAGGWSSTKVRGTKRKQSPSSKGRLVPATVLPKEAIAALKAEIGANPSVSRFYEFYESRLAEELQRAKPRLAARVRDMFMPVVRAELVSLSGRTRSLVQVVGAYRYDDGPSSTFNLVVDSETRGIVEGPEFGLCEITRKYCPIEDLAECEVTGKSGLAHLMLSSGLSGKLMMPGTEATCAVTGMKLLPSEAEVSDFSGRKVAPEHIVVCAVTERPAASDEVEECQFTSALVHRSQLSVSEISGKSYRRDQSETCVVTNTTGHVSELVQCQSSGKYALPGETAASGVSGSVVLRRLLVPSDMASNRLALRSELIECQESGRLLFPDETASSLVSGKVVGKDLLVKSSYSEGYALASEMLICSVSGDYILPSQAVTCEFTSRTLSPRFSKRCAVTGRVAGVDQMGTCEFSQVEVHNSQLVSSEASGKRYRSDEQLQSALSGKKGHRSEFGECEITGTRVLLSELVRSDASGMLVRADEIATSSKGNGRRAANAEMVRCQSTGASLLPDEVAASAQSGLLVDRDLLTPSALSGKLGLESELFTCEESGTRVLVSETATCEATGKRVRADLAGTSAVSGSTFLLRLLRTCPETGVLGTDAEFVTCEVTGQLVAPEAVESCSETNKIVVRRLLAPCEVCSKLLLRSVGVRTHVGEFVHASHTVASAFTGHILLKSAVRNCSATGLAIEGDLVIEGFAKPVWDALDMVDRAPANTNEEVVSAAQIVLSSHGARLAAAWAAGINGNGVIAIVARSKRRGLLAPRTLAFVLDSESSRIMGDVAFVVKNRNGWQAR